MVNHCQQCGTRNVLLFPQREEGVPTLWICTNCVRAKTAHYKYDHRNEDNVGEPYVLKWKLRNTETGQEWIEEHVEMSLSDFEVVYGNNIHDILWIIFRKENQAVL